MRLRRPKDSWQFRVYISLTLVLQPTGKPMTIVKLIQTSKYQWRLLSPKGTVMVDDLAFPSQYKAEEWIKAFISGQMGWDYEILGLTKGIT